MKNLFNKILASSALGRKVRILLSGNEKEVGNEEGIIDKNLLYDMQTIEVMRRVLGSDSNCVDVGCHQGAILKEMIRFAPNGIHFAFEPLPDLYQSLLKEFGDNRSLKIFNYALGDASGIVSFQHVVTNPGYSGFLKRRYDRPNEKVIEITVEAELLDNMIPEEVKIDFIKIDVEGAEFQVLRGSAETVNRCKPVIVFEHGLGAADYYETTPEMMFDLLHDQCGLNVFLMSEWLDTEGRGSLSRDAFCEQFYSGNNYYFMATA